MIFLAPCVLAQQAVYWPAPQRDLREAAYRVIDILETCPPYKDFSNAIYDPPHRAAILHLVDETMRRLQPVPTPVLTEAVRIVYVQGSDAADPEYLRFERRRLRSAPWLNRLSSKERHTRLRNLAWWLSERAFYIDRFLFAAPEREPFTGSAAVFHISAFNAIHGQFIDRAYPFHFASGAAVSLTAPYSLTAHVGGGGSDELAEYHFYLQRYPRRKPWWPGAKRG